jgi:copper chaperone NosL
MCAAMKLKKGRKVLLVCLAAGLLLVLSCRQNTIEPVAIVAGDMCSYCKMDISEKRFAAEFIDRDGQPFKFDEIGCMLSYIREKKNKTAISAYFVMDFNQKEWLKADDAYYVRSEELTTPMNGGIVAFRDEAKAQEAVSKFHGKLLRFNELVERH